MSTPSNARTMAGWIVVDCDASDTTAVYIAIGRADAYRPAFRDWVDGVRVAKIRIPKDAPVGRQAIFVKWGDKADLAGKVLLRSVAPN